MKYALILSSLMFSFGAGATELNCRSKYPETSGDLRFSATIDSADRLSDLKLTMDDTARAEAATVERDASYKPRKYKGYVRFSFDADEIQYEVFDLLLPQNFVEQETPFTAILLERASDGGGTTSLSCELL